MAKTMMFENVAVLELSTNRAKNKDTGVRDGKSYHTLNVYEFNQPYPELIKLKVTDELLDLARSLVAKKCSILANVSLFNNQMSLYFSEGSLATK